jgi:hypothetical protein
MAVFPERGLDMNLEKNLSEVRKHLSGQTIVAATKYVQADTIRSLFSLGISDMGENHVQTLFQKQQLLSDLPIKWHFIGHLQTNKVKLMINHIDFLHSLDSLKLVAEIQKFRKTPLDCFIEINISRETAKTGMNADELTNFVNELAKYDKIRVIGLMGMAENTESRDVILSQFQFLAALQKTLKEKRLPYAPCEFLSMGMSGDYLIAIACGATHLRLGSILFRNED